MNLIQSISNLISGSPKDKVIWESYCKYFEQKPSKNTPISNLSFLVLDTETTGLDYKKDKILSLATLLVKDYKIDVATRMEAFFQQEKYEANEGVKIHGILQKHVEAGRTEREILIQLLQIVQNHIIVGHHIGFDAAILNRALQRHFGFKLKNKTLDTAWLAKRIDNPHSKGINPASLDELCDTYEIPAGKRHTAAGDTYITAILFMKLMYKLEKRGVQTYGELF